jgi:Right handed beta helix region
MFCSKWCLMLIIVVFATVPGLSQGRTWFVEKDGSGDYTIIQDAIDAAAAGDTVRIGPGRFDDYGTYTYPGGEYEIVANNTIGSLTIIGAGADVTYVGVATDDPVYLSAGFFNVATPTDGSFSITDLSVEGKFFGFITENACEFLVANCTFRDCTYAVESFVSGSVSVCQFIDIDDIGISAFAPGRDLTVTNCEFVRCGSYGFLFQGSPNMNVSSCTFTDCFVGGYFDISSGSVSDCSFGIAPGGTGLGFDGNGQVLISGCTISNAYRNLYIVGASNLIFEGNIFNPTEAESINICNCTPVFHNNHILPGSGYSVYLGCSLPSEGHLDLTNNYWGTTEPDSIAAWIFDANDVGGPRFGTVDFEPFSATPLPADRPSFEGFKAMFR